MASSFMIRKCFSNSWLETTIDSFGMRVHFGSILHADTFNTREDAEKFLTRVQERYPTEKLEIIPESLL